MRYKKNAWFDYIPWFIKIPDKQWKFSLNYIYYLFLAAIINLTCPFFLPNICSNFGKKFPCYLFAIYLSFYSLKIHLIKTLPFTLSSPPPCSFYIDHVYHSLSLLENIFLVVIFHCRKRNNSIKLQIKL